MTHIVQKLLAFFARKILAKYRPIVVGITGSVGKTSTKEAVFLAVSQKFKAYRPVKNFNNEFGLPFAIIGVDSPGRNVWKWILVFARAKSLWLLPRAYPELLVLEYGVDKPGDMDYLLSIAKPDISVITSIGLSHYQFFDDADAIELEKSKIAKVLTDRDTLIVNGDNEKALRQTMKTKARVLTYGQTDPADIYKKSAEEEISTKPETRMVVRTKDGDITLMIHAAGKPHVYAALAAVSVAKSLGVEPSLIEQGLALYKPAPGRLNIIAGIKQSIVIDDSYNASPDSMREALALFDRTHAPYKIAVLGSMRELGNIEEAAHIEIGTLVAGIQMDYLITVAAGGNMIAEAAKTAGMPEGKVLSFTTSDEAKRMVQELMKPGSLVLVKGSQNTVFLEKVVKEIMAEPMRAAELLCRQNPEWLAKK